MECSNPLVADQIHSDSSKKKRNENDLTKMQRRPDRPSVNEWSPTADIRRTKRFSRRRRHSSFVSVYLFKCISSCPFRHWRPFEMHLICSRHRAPHAVDRLKQDERRWLIEIISLKNYFVFSVYDWRPMSAIGEKLLFDWLSRPPLLLWLLHGDAC